MKKIVFAALIVASMTTFPNLSLAESDWVTNKARNLNNAIEDAGRKLERFPPTSVGGRKIREQAEENRRNHPELRDDKRRSRDDDDDE